VPTIPPIPANVLVSLLIQDSVSKNVSIAANKKELEDNLAAYYKNQKQLTTTVIVTATVSQTQPNSR